MPSKYKVGDELIILSNKDDDTKKIQDMTELKIIDNYFAQISMGLQILEVEYDKPYVTLTYRNMYGKTNKVFAECSDIANFNNEKVLEKALLKAFQMEMIDLSVIKNKGKGWKSPY